MTSLEIAISSKKSLERLRLLPLLSGRSELVRKDNAGLLFGLGQPVLDVVAQVTGEFLESCKLSDEYFNDLDKRALGMVGLVFELFDVEHIAGGSTQNCLVMSQWLLSVPHATTFIGCVGHDNVGEVLTKTLEDSGVKVVAREIGTQDTGLCIGIETDATRKLVLRIGAAGNSVKETLQTLTAAGGDRGPLDSARCFYVEALTLRYDVGAAIEIGRYAAANDRYFCLNLSATHAPFGGSICDIESLLPYVDVLVSGEAALDASVSLESDASQRLELKALRLASWRKTNGARGRLVIVPRQTAKSIVVRDGVVLVYPAINQGLVTSVDSVGMIDAFCGGFLALLGLGGSLEECLDAGIKAAFYSLLVRGCTPPKHDASAITFDRRRARTTSLRNSISLQVASPYVR